MSSTPEPPVARPKTLAELMWESAWRTFLQAAVPAFLGALTATREANVTMRDFVIAAAMAAGAAGLAAVMRAVVPVVTDRRGTYRQDLLPERPGR